MTPKIKAMIELEKNKYSRYDSAKGFHDKQKADAFKYGATFMHSYYAPRLKKAIEALKELEIPYNAFSPTKMPRLPEEIIREALAELSEDFSEAKPL